MNDREKPQESWLQRIYALFGYPKCNAFEYTLQDTEAPRLFDEVETDE